MDFNFKLYTDGLQAIPGILGCEIPSIRGKIHFTSQLLLWNSYCFLTKWYKGREVDFQLPFISMAKPMLKVFLIRAYLIVL